LKQIAGRVATPGIRLGPRMIIVDAITREGLQ
jgi:hypothetical protein